jgi:hypothetical protein
MIAKAKNKKKCNGKTYVVIKEENNSKVFSNGGDKSVNGSCFIRNNGNVNNYYNTENNLNTDIWEVESSPLYSNFSQFTRPKQTNNKNSSIFHSQSSKIHDQRSI